MLRPRRSISLNLETLGWAQILRCTQNDNMVLNRYKISFNKITGNKLACMNGKKWFHRKLLIIKDHAAERKLSQGMIIQRFNISLEMWDYPPVWTSAGHTIAWRTRWRG